MNESNAVRICEICDRHGTRSDLVNELLYLHTILLIEVRSHHFAGFQSTLPYLSQW